MRVSHGVGRSPSRPDSDPRGCSWSTVMHGRTCCYIVPGASSTTNRGCRGTPNPTFFFGEITAHSPQLRIPIVCGNRHQEALENVLSYTMMFFSPGKDLTVAESAFSSMADTVLDGTPQSACNDVRPHSRNPPRIANDRVPHRFTAHGDLFHLNDELRARVVQ